MLNLKTNAEKQRSAAIQSRVTLAAEVRLRRSLMIEMGKVSRASAKAMRDDPANVNAALLPMQAHTERVDKLLAASFKPLMTTFSNMVEEAADAKSLLTYERKDFAFAVQQMILEWTSTRALSQSVLIGSTTGNIVKQALIEAEAANFTVAQTSSLIQQRVGPKGLGAMRSNAIARTEMHSASQAASLGSVEALGLPLLKEWISVEDDRTRSSHARTADEGGPDGLKVPKEEPFNFDGEETRVSLDYPGDPSGPAEEVINCRCAMVYETPAG